MHEAGIQDRDGAHGVVERAIEKNPTLKKLWLDAGYAGRCLTRLQEDFGIDAEVVRRRGEGDGEWTLPGETLEPAKAGFQIVKRRWVVERTFGWLGRARRLSKDYEGRIDTSEAWLWVAALRLMLARFAALPAGS